MHFNSCRKESCCFLIMAVKIWNRRIVFNESGKESFTSGPYDYKFEIWLNNQSSDPMYVYVGSDSMMVNDFPKDTDASCEEYFNHFVKE